MSRKIQEAIGEELAEFQKVPGEMVVKVPLSMVLIDRSRKTAYIPLRVLYVAFAEQDQK